LYRSKVLEPQLVTEKKKKKRKSPTLEGNGLYM